MKYRELQPGETLVEGDEIDIYADGEWKPIVCGVGATFDERDRGLFRRPIRTIVVRFREPLLRRIVGTLRRIFFR